MTEDVVLPPRKPPRIKPRKKPKRGRPNGLSTATAEEMAARIGEWGPAMRALPDDRYRVFVISMFQTKPGHGSAVRAAKMAGFGTTTSSSNSWAVIATRLVHDTRVQAALLEHGARTLRGSLFPQAIASLTNLIVNPLHRDHVRALGMVMDRAIPIETSHSVHVTHEDNRSAPVTEEMIERIVRLARAVGMNPDTLPPVTIEEKAIEIVEAEIIEDKP